MKGKEERGEKLEVVRGTEKWNIKGCCWGGVTFIQQGASMKNKCCVCVEQGNEEEERRKCIEQKKKKGKMIVEEDNN